MKKEYVLKIIYDGLSDEIEHLSEKFEEIGYSIEVDGKDIPITTEMAKYMVEYVDGEEMGVS